MKDKELKLAAKFLELSSEEFTDHGCNDVSEEYWEGWTIEERQEFVKGYYEYNGDPDVYDPEYLHLPDYAIMGYLAYLMNK